ncbi:DUF2855 family protein [Exilibacterium tricleocarpae]|uniref:DUF2855 family protein n=1 Tax=Exilibacterium tricleocarpae TaxID=2591008 RepID=A0A545SPX9_9GAMM|nr:DUF2855 family protein [Exilibacterium tricleocarpae]TQV67007.1 DUF2855 family protein [Exilibacterium tricleocarpae]
MSNNLAAQDFLVQRQALDQTRFATATGDRQALQPRQVLLAVDRFAFTANNITYAIMGDALSYWAFFPAEEPWGRIPVWGFADVVASASDDIKVGERIYGFFPLSTHLVVEVGKVTAGTFTDLTPHRSDLPGAYNVYLRCSKDTSARMEDLQALLRPLFTTAFLIDDFLADAFLSDKTMFDAGQVILSSASSKTAFGTAFMLHKNRDSRADYQIIGLTSAANRAFVEGLGCYDRVVDYADLATLEQRPSAYIDMAGNGDLRSRLHHHLGDAMVYSCQVGAAHWDQAVPTKDLPGAKPTMFFAPTQLKKRSEEWGADQLQARIAAAWQVFIDDLAQGSLEVVHKSGPDAIEAVYRETLAGKAIPDKGYILSF